MMRMVYSVLVYRAKGKYYLSVSSDTREFQRFFNMGAEEIFRRTREAVGQDFFQKLMAEVREELKRRNIKLDSSLQEEMNEKTSASG